MSSSSDSTAASLPQPSTSSSSSSSSSSPSVPQSSPQSSSSSSPQQPAAAAASLTVLHKLCSNSLPIVTRSVAELLHSTSSISHYLASPEAAAAVDEFPRPPRLMRRSSYLSEFYYMNHKWKSLIARVCTIIYMSVVFWIMFKRANPWYEFFYYLTLQGWTLELVYFIYSTYLDIMSHWYGGPDYISRFSRTAVQALSELVFALQIVIVGLFWLVIYPQQQWRSIMWELNTHGMGLMLMIVDYLYRFTRFSLRNHRYIVGFTICYSSLYSFVVLYLKKSIYPGIDFKSTRSIVIFFFGLSALVLTHKIFYLVSNWKWVRHDVKSAIGIAKIILLRQNSTDVVESSNSPRSRRASSVESDSVTVAAAAAVESTSKSFNSSSSSGDKETKKTI